jgi:membrane protease YdiL (CAAX protease family)
MATSWKRVWVYLALVFPLSWALWIPVMRDKTNPVFLDLSGGPALAAMWVACTWDGSWRNRARGLAFAVILFLSFAVVTLNNAPLHFNPWLLLPSAISAWILSGAFSGDTGVRSLMRGVVRPPNWRWPIITLLILPVFLLATAGAGRLLGLPVSNPAQGLTAIQLAGVCGVRFFHNLLFTAAFEEPGWRGFLLPRLQTRFSPLTASVLVWLPWAVWHLPLDITRPGWGLLMILQARGIVLLIFSILITWVYNRSGGGLLSALVFHGAVNSFPFILPSCGPLLTPAAAVLVVAAVVSSRMWRKPVQENAG